MEGGPPNNNRQQFSSLHCNWGRHGGSERCTAERREEREGGRESTAKNVDHLNLENFLIPQKSRKKKKKNSTNDIGEWRRARTR